MVGPGESPIKAWIAHDTIAYSREYNFRLGATMDKQRKLQLIETSGLATGIDNDHLWATMTDSDLWIHVAIPLDVVRTFNHDNAEAFTALKEHIFTIASYEYVYASPVGYNLSAKRFEAMSPRLVLRVLEFRYFGLYRGLTSRHADKSVRDYRSEKSGHPELYRSIERIEHSNRESAQISNQAQLLKQAHSGQASLETLPELYPHPKTRVSLGSCSGVDAAQVRVGGEREPGGIKQQPPMNGYLRAVNWTLPQFTGPSHWSPRDRTKAESPATAAPAVSAPTVEPHPVGSTSKVPAPTSTVQTASNPAPAVEPGAKADPFPAPMTVVEPVRVPPVDSPPKFPKKEPSKALATSSSLSEVISSLKEVEEHFYEDWTPSSPPERKRRRTSSSSASSSSTSIVRRYPSSAATMANDDKMDVEDLHPSEDEKAASALSSSSALRSNPPSRASSCSSQLEEDVKPLTIKIKGKHLEFLCREEGYSPKRARLAQDEQPPRKMDTIIAERVLPPRPPTERHLGDLSASAFRSSQMPRPGQMPTATFEPLTPLEDEGDSTQLSGILPLEMVTQVEGQPNAGQGQGRRGSFAPTQPESSRPNGRAASSPFTNPPPSLTATPTATSIVTSGPTSEASTIRATRHTSAHPTLHDPTPKIFEKDIKPIPTPPTALLTERAPQSNLAELLVPAPGVAHVEPVEMDWLRLPDGFKAFVPSRPAVVKRWKKEVG
ncbi:BZ3500_MvSof-1268-A1-R1_Chr2-1g04384 [Microbotryum saponariae]|uniref:BZ3500_MvSof-1268-A1-R1_Chr2-1g04384 protein n=1 Tax=Microbotryum saponariae TaxID=289078 RepID=A0A2X0KIW1_9BASI|nr:BZ3500_MvSof-1268-A1-R1_Chr2-1g04384 [Microbotryum saponariae]SCZ91598.1 BZ3501_MvSof-1269-A2-R1_Chr2-1g04040 [Microbotryum saponariae]